jgi:hypothetical protein
VLRLLVDGVGGDGVGAGGDGLGHQLLHRDELVAGLGISISLLESQRARSTSQARSVESIW